MLNPFRKPDTQAVKTELYAIFNATIRANYEKSREFQEVASP
jgi:hypothetical protein